MQRPMSRTPAVNTVRPKPLELDSPVTEVRTLETADAAPKDEASDSRIHTEDMLFLEQANRGPGKEMGHWRSRHGS